MAGTWLSGFALEGSLFAGEAFGFERGSRCAGEWLGAAFSVSHFFERGLHLLLSGAEAGFAGGKGCFGGLAGLI